MNYIVLILFGSFSFLAKAENGNLWCSPNPKDKFVLEWLEPNSQDLLERTLVIKYKSSGKIFASLKGQVSNYSQNREYSLLEDYNFDDCPDISWESGMNVKGDKTYEVFLYSKQSSSFDYSEELSAISNLEVSSSLPNCLSSYSSNTYGDFYGDTSEIYCWKDNKLITTERDELLLDKERDCSHFQKYKLISEGDLSLVEDTCNSLNN